MTSTRLLPNGRRRWLTTGSFAVALAVVVGSQVHPMNAHADGAPAAFIGPSAAVVAAHAVAAPSPVAADAAPTADAPAADTGTVRIAPAHTPAKAPKAPKKAAPHKAA